MAPHPCPLADEGFGILLNPSEEQLEEIYEGIRSGGYLDSVFYEGGIETPWAFINFAKDPFNTFFAMHYKGTIEACAWLNCFEGRTARVHFSTLPICKPGHSIKHGLNFTRWCLTAPNPEHLGHSWLNTLVGCTPANNKLALRFIKRIGFKIMGQIPEALVPVKSQTFTDIVVSTLNRRDI